ncbi:MAG: PilN domain-containing protein [Rhodospirillales bacterium]
MKQRLTRLRGTVRAFFAWWSGELAAMLPPRLLRWLRPEADRLILELAEDALIVRHAAGPSARDLGRVRLTSGEREAERSAVADLVDGVGSDRTTVTLRLPQRQALRKVLDLPAAAEESLRQLLALEMDRQTPFSSDEVYFDYRVVGRRRETRRIDVEIVVVPRAIVDAAVSRARGWGLAPDTVDIARDDTESAVPLNILPESAAPRGSRLVGALSVVFAVVAALLAVAVVQQPLERQRAEVERLAREVAAARAEAETGRRLEEEIGRLVRQDRFIVEKKNRQPPLVAVLGEVTRLLPDDTWLFRMRVFEGDVQTFGYSPAASTLIGAIEQSDLFESAQFRAPTTRDPRVDADRFHIAFRIVGTAKP